MQPTSSRPLAAVRRGERPAVDAVRDGVWSIPIPNPAGRGPAYTFCYAIEDVRGDVHLVDPGWPDAAADTLRHGLEAVGHALQDVATVSLTHVHPDHSGAAGIVVAASGAQIIMFADEVQTSAAFARMIGEYDPTAQLREWGAPASVTDELGSAPPHAAAFPPAVPDVVVEDGDLLPIAGRSVQVMHTPGHTAGHMALRLDEEHLIFTGDHLLPRTHPGIGLGGADPAPFGRYLQALVATAQLADHEAAPGHEFRFRGIPDRCATTAAHHLRRSRDAARILHADPDATVWQVASQLTWTQGFAALAGFVLYSALAQTRMHVDFVGSDDGRAAIRDGWWDAAVAQHHQNAATGGTGRKTT